LRLVVHECESIGKAARFTAVPRDVGVTWQLDEKRPLLTCGSRDGSVPDAVVLRSPVKHALIATSSKVGISGQSLPVFVRRPRRPCERADASLSHNARPITTRVPASSGRGLLLRLGETHQPSKAMSNEKRMIQRSTVRRDLSARHWPDIMALPETDASLAKITAHFSHFEQCRKACGSWTLAVFLVVSNEPRLRYVEADRTVMSSMKNAAVPLGAASRAYFHDLPVQGGPRCNGK